MDTHLTTVGVAGVKIVATTKTEFLNWLEGRVISGQQTFLATPYGEFLYEALRNPEFRWVLNQFDANIADGVSVQWASVFLSPSPDGRGVRGEGIRVGNWHLNILKTFFRVIVTGSWILLSPGKIRKAIPEKITGSDFVWDIAELAERNNWSVMLAGGFGDTAEIVRDKLLQKFPNLNIVGTSNVEIEDVFLSQKSSHGEDPDALGRGTRQSCGDSDGIASSQSLLAMTDVEENGSAKLLSQIQQLKPDVLLLAVGPFKQERFLIYNRKNLPVKFAIGLGGTFDYIAGKKLQPPKFIRKIGLEWLFRLFTQPSIARIKRIYNATFGLVMSLVKRAVYSNKPFRQNVAVVIINHQQQVLICRRNYDYISRSFSRYRKMESWNAEHWQLPQGGLDAGETIEQAGHREAKEEVGLENLQVLKVAAHAHEYLFPIGNKPLFRPNPYKGQSQSLVYLKYSGDPEAVKVDGEEFDRYAWVRREELVDRVHVVRKELAEKVVGLWPSSISNP